MYAGNMGLFDRIKNYSLPYKKNNSDWYVPLTKITSDNNGFLIENLEKIMLNSGRATAGLIDALHTPFTETADNIFYHSGTLENAGWGFACGHVISDELTVSFADIGIGFRGAFARGGKVVSTVDAELILNAFERGVTSTSDPYRGIGLFEVRDYVKMSGSSLEVRSARGVVNIRNQRQNAFDGTWDLCGALVTLKIRL